MLFEPFPKLLKVVAEAFHEFAANYDGVVVDEVEVSDGFLVLADKHEGVGAEQGEMFGERTEFTDEFGECGLKFLVECLAFVVNPVFNNATGYFMVVVVEYAQFAAFLLHLKVEVGEWEAFCVGGELGRGFAQCALDLLNGTFGEYHGGRVFWSYEFQRYNIF